MNAGTIVNMVFVLGLVIGGFLFFAYKAARKEKDRKS